MERRHAWVARWASSTRMPPFPLLLPSLATHTPAAQNQAVQNWAGGGAGCGSDTLSGWEGALAADLWKGAWGPGHLASQRGRKPREANGAERLEHSSPRPSLQSCPEPQLPLQSLCLQSPPAITAVGWDREEDVAPNIPSWAPMGGIAGVRYPGTWGLLGTVLFTLSSSSPVMCPALYSACVIPSILTTALGPQLSLSAPFDR